MRITARGRSSYSLLALVWLLFSGACEESRTPSEPEREPLPDGLTWIDVRPDVVRLTIGGTYALTAIGSDSRARLIAGVVLDWRSSDAYVVSVDAKTGVVTGKTIGVATISGASSGHRDSVRIVVSPNNQFGIEFSSLSSVGNYACGLEEETNLAYCWGDSDSGALGVSEPESYDLPVLVGYGTRRFRNLSVSAYWNCAIEVGTDLPFCWGLMTDWSQGEKWSDEIHVPTLVGGGRLRFSSITAGTEVTCGIEVRTGRAYCWGAGDLGWVAKGTTSASRHSARVRASCAASSWALRARTAGDGTRAVSSVTAPRAPDCFRLSSRTARFTSPP
jgi:hypothetical protein